MRAWDDSRRAALPHLDQGDGLVPLLLPPVSAVAVRDLEVERRVVVCHGFTRTRRAATFPNADVLGPFTPCTEDPETDGRIETACKQIRTEER